MTTLPSSIAKTELTCYDAYSGPLDDLIAAGLVRRDQLPQPGKRSISWLNGVFQPRRCPQNEHYMRVVVHDDGTADVQIGLSAEVAAPRKVAARIKWQKAEAEWRAQLAQEKEDRTRQAREKQEADAQDERVERARLAKRDLQSTLRMSCESDFRSHVANGFRRSIKFYAEVETKASTWHGYRLANEAQEALLMAAEALVDAMMQSEVIFDAALHEKIIADYRAKIRAADPKFDRQFTALSTPAPFILAGEQQ